MKTLMLILLSVGALAAMGVLFLCPAEAQGADVKAAAAGHKILLVYYSRSGSNYVSGDIVNLPVGNTAAVAEMIREMTGADVFEIKTVKPYPADYRETTEVAKAEMQAQARPEIVGGVENVEQYDTIILGYPNWWGTMPMAVFSFLEKHRIEGKRILPFCTHEGSAMGRSIRDLHKALPNAEVKKGLPIKGSRVYKKDASVRNELEAWLSQNL